MLWCALRPPMRQWWRKTGVWWIAALVLLAVAPVLIDDVILSSSVLGNGEFSPRFRWAWPAFTVLQGLSGSARLLVVFVGLVLALLAARACLRAAATLIEDSLISSTRTSSSALFLCALRQALWPLALIVIAHCGILEGGDIATRVPWGTAVFTVWLVAVMTVMRPNYQLVWSWVILGTIAPICVAYASYFLSFQYSSWNMSWATSAASPVELLRFGWVIGAVLMPLLIRSALRQHRRATSALFTIILVSVVLNPLCYINIIPARSNSTQPYNAPPGATPSASQRIADSLSGSAQFYASGLAWFGYRTHAHAPPEWIECDEAFIACAAPVVWSIAVQDWVKDPLLIVNAAYLALIIWFIAAVLLRQRAAPRSAGYPAGIP